MTPPAVTPPAGGFSSEGEGGSIEAAARAPPAPNREAGPWVAAPPPPPRAPVRAASEGGWRCGPPLAGSLVGTFTGARSKEPEEEEERGPLPPAAVTGSEAAGGLEAAAGLGAATGADSVDVGIAAGAPTPTIAAAALVSGEAGIAARFIVISPEVLSSAARLEPGAGAIPWARSARPAPTPPAPAAPPSARTNAGASSGDGIESGMRHRATADFGGAAPGGGASGGSEDASDRTVSPAVTSIRSSPGRRPPGLLDAGGAAAGAAGAAAVGIIAVGGRAVARLLVVVRGGGSSSCPSCSLLPASTSPSLALEANEAS